MPPMKVFIGLRSPVEIMANLRRSLVSRSCLVFPSDMDCAMFSATLTKSSASSVMPGLGRWPFVCWNSSSARNATWSKAGRSSLAKSHSKKSPGSEMASARGLKLMVFGSLTLCTSPLEVYLPNPEVSPSNSNEYAFTFFTRICLPSLSSVIPATSVKLTRSPSWNSSLSSSTHVTSAGLLFDIEETMPTWGSSPSTSETTKPWPKSQNTLAKRPRVSALMKAILFLWQYSSRRLAVPRAQSVTTTVLN
mmetsp:Transcript_3168/g.7807  ORF Transcript_3168/g.7807 Transcript_3168/m.7807 type:complete len:249 (-) Transcript_3168:436-1182(-)